ncbi:hypothetical protein HDU92_006371 [Lobulomyces angularis]|nr:hypothetical protein HDU92_006371 [Lobulomyces angularis]
MTETVLLIKGNSKDDEKCKNLDENLTNLPGVGNGIKISTHNLKKVASKSKDVESLETTTENLAETIAAFVRAFLMKSTITLSGFGKGFLKYWFRTPVKFFRPSTLNPWALFSAMASAEEKKANFRFVRSVVKNEGIQVIGRNMLPLMLANAFVGAVLFNVYAITSDFLEFTYGFQYKNAFAGGFLGGFFQSFLSVPLDNIQRSISGKDLINYRSDGVFKVLKLTLEKILPPSSSKVNFWSLQKHVQKFLYKKFFFICLKDSLGFMMFFGIFEGMKNFSKTIVADAFNLKGIHYINENDVIIESSDKPSSIDEKNIVHKIVFDNQSQVISKEKRPFSATLANSAAVLTAGAMAGCAYQMTVFPLEKVRKVMDFGEQWKMKENLNRKGGIRFKLNLLSTVLKRRGIKTFYRGIGPKLITAMPPSALGLLAYEVCSSQFWDND